MRSLRHMVVCKFELFTGIDVYHQERGLELT